MPEAKHDHTTLTPRIVRVTAPISVTLHQPGKTRRAPPNVITGRLVAKAYRGDTLHHYRVAGTDGVLYLAPPDWLVGSRLLAAVEDDRPSLLRELAATRGIRIKVLGEAELGA